MCHRLCVIVCVQAACGMRLLAQQQAVSVPPASHSATFWCVGEFMYK